MYTCIIYFNLQMLSYAPFRALIVKQLAIVYGLQRGLAFMICD